VRATHDHSGLRPDRSEGEKRLTAGGVKPMLLDKQSPKNGGR
jgi:hypothetical protein